MSIQDAAAIVAMLVVAVPVGVYVVAACRRSLKSFATVKWIAEQLKPNSGKTTLDKIIRMDEKLDNLIAVNTVSMNLVSYPLFRSDHSGHVDWVNRQFTHETGLSESEAFGFGWLNSVSEDERMAVKMEWLRAIEDSRAIRLDVALHDGRKFTLEALPVISGGSLKQMLGAIRLVRNMHE